MLGGACALPAGSPSPDRLRLRSALVLSPLAGRGEAACGNSEKPLVKLSFAASVR